MDEMYIRTDGKIEQFPENKNMYRCTPTVWCATTEEALSVGTLEPRDTTIRELGEYNLIAQGEEIDELRLMLLLEDL